MVTGFNTDVEHAGHIYHVQTEDKGVDNPLIETLVYRGGEILAARRNPYEDLRAGGFDEAAITRRIEEQHNAVIADVRAGHFEAKKPRPFGEGIISSRSFDEVVLDFLRSEMGPDPLVVSVLDPGVLRESTTAKMEILVTRAHTGDGVAGADVRVRLITNAGKPRNLATGRTGDSGVAEVEVALPALGRGVAAVVVQVQSGKDTAETRQAVGSAGSPAPAPAAGA